MGNTLSAIGCLVLSVLSMWNGEQTASGAFMVAAATFASQTIIHIYSREEGNEHGRD